MNIQRAKNTKRNAFWGIINKVITLFLPYLIRTVMIHTLGAEYLGLSSLFSSILQVLNLTELGLTSAIVYCMYKPVAENDNETICALLNLYRKIYRYIGIIILSIGIVLIPILPRLINGSPPSDISIYVVYLVYMINTVISYLLFAYKAAIPTALQRNDMISNIGTITQGTMYMVQILVLIYLKNYYTYIIFLPISTLINNLITSIWVDKTFPQFKCKGSVSKKIKYEIKTNVKGLMINKVCQTTRNALDSICVSAFLGLAATTMYNNYYFVINALIGLTQVIISSMLAGVGNSIIVETREKNYADMKKFNFLYMWIMGWCTITLVCLYQPFMELSFGSELLFPYYITIAFALYFYALKIGDIRGLFSDAAGLWWENRYRAIAESIGNIVLNVVLVQIWGVLGIIVATMISLLIINFGFGSQIVFKYYFKNHKLGEYFRCHGQYFLITVLVGIITVLIGNRIQGSALFVLSMRSIICLILPNFLYILIYYRTKDYRIAIPWVLVKFKLTSKLHFLIPKDKN